MIEGLSQDAQVRLRLILEGVDRARSDLGRFQDEVQGAGEVVAELDRALARTISAGNAEYARGV